MGFGTNYSAAQDYGLIPPGTYETVIANAGVKQTQNGKYKVSFSLVIRNDVQQTCQNRYLFLDIWRKKEPNANDEMVDGFNFAQLMNVAKAAAIPDGTNFETLEQFLRTLTGRCLRVAVTHREWNGEAQVNIDQLRGLTQTQFPECRHVQKQQPQTPAYGSVAQRPPQQFAAQQQYAPAPQSYAQQPLPHAQPQPYAPAPANLNPDDFEEILGDHEVPF